MHVRLSAVATFYTGVPAQDVGDAEFEETLTPKAGMLMRQIVDTWFDAGGLMRRYVGTRS